MFMMFSQFHALKEKTAIWCFDLIFPASHPIHVHTLCVQFQIPQCLSSQQSGLFPATFKSAFLILCHLFSVALVSCWLSLISIGRIAAALALTAFFFEVLVFPNVLEDLFFFLLFCLSCPLVSNQSKHFFISVI